MATDKEIRKVRPGWQVVWFEGCSLYDGRPNRATAETIVKRWYPTRKEAEQA